ncbi:MAG: precorrin-6A reductase [Oscillospiraceae bacterium]
MSEILIFGGTTEGRILAEYCDDYGIPAWVSVTTEYGASLLPNGVEFSEGKMDSGQISAFISERGFRMVIDATHPYARAATANIKAACEELKVPYYRVLREESGEILGRICNDVSAVVDYLNGSEKRALITTGSKELAAFTKVRNFAERLFVRVLPAEGIEEQCVSLGFRRENLIVEKGPFSVEQNIAHICNSGAEILVTKESGSAGGYPEKCEAARVCGIELITILRPKESGISVEEMKKILGKERL